MSAITKSRTNFISVFKSLFSSGIDVEIIDEDKLPKELEDILRTVDSKGKKVEQPITANVSNNSKKGGFGKKINPIENKDTEKAMRAIHKEIQPKVSGDRERD